MTASLDDPSAQPDGVVENSADATIAAPHAKQKAATKPPATKAPMTKTAAVRTAAARKSTKPAATAASTSNTAAKASAVKTVASQSAAAKTAAAKSSAAKTAAAKSAASRSAANKSAAKATDSKSAAAKTAAAKTAAAKAAATKAAKAAAAKAAAEERATTETSAGKTTVSKATVRTSPAKKRAPKVKPVVSAEDATPTSESVTSPTTGSETLVAALFESDLLEVTADESVVNDSVLEEPVVEEPIVEEPVVAEPIAEETVIENIVADDPVVTDTPAASAVREGVPIAVDDSSAADAIVIRGLVKNFGDHRAVNEIDLTVRAGTFYGIVGPNGAGKTTTLSILAGLLRANAGKVVICGIDQAADPLAAKRVMGVLPDRLRTFDRLTGRQLLHYYGLLRGLSADVIEKRTTDLARAFDLVDALSRVVSDYSAGMTKKVMLAGAMIHSPRVLVLDEPFEAVDPVSSAVILDILRAYVAHGGTVILSSHGMDLVERVCSRVAIIVDGVVLAEGTIDEVRAGQTLEARFVELSGGIGEVEGLEWLHTFSD